MKEPKKANYHDSSKYSHMSVNVTSRAILLFFCVLAAVFFGVLIFENIGAGNPWTTIAGPICFLGLCFVAVPEVETWVYDPWQSKHQKYEEHINE